ncbi:hypothetical protein AHAS_AhasUnG0043600 [Arachis hypogaea]
MREYEQSSEMSYFPEPQSDSYCDGTYTNDGCEGKCNDSHSNYLRTLSLDCAARAYLEDCLSMPQNNPHCDEFVGGRIKTKKHSEPLSKKNEDHLVDVKEKVEEQDEEASVSSKISMEKEVVEAIKPEAAYPQKPLEIKEHEDSQPPQTSLNQRPLTLESVIEKYEEEMKKFWEEQQTSSMKVLLSQ